MLELINFHRLCHVRIEDVFLSDIVAFFPYLLLGSDNFVFDLKCAEAELTELLGEVVWRNLYHSKVRWLLDFRYRR